MFQTVANPYASDIYRRAERVAALLEKRAEALPSAQPVSLDDRNFWTRTRDTWGTRGNTIPTHLRHPSQRGVSSGQFIDTSLQPAGESYAFDLGRNWAAEYIGGMGTWDQIRFGLSTIMGKIWNSLFPNSERPNPFSFHLKKERDIKRNMLQRAGIPAEQISAFSDEQLDGLDHKNPQAAIEQAKALGIHRPLEQTAVQQGSLTPLAAQYNLETRFGGDQARFDAALKTMDPEAYNRELLATTQDPEFRTWAKDKTGPTSVISVGNEAFAPKNLWRSPVYNAYSGVRDLVKNRTQTSALEQNPFSTKLDTGLVGTKVRARLGGESTGLQGIPGEDADVSKVVRPS